MIIVRFWGNYYKKWVPGAQLKQGYKTNRNNLGFEFLETTKLGLVSVRS